MESEIEMVEPTFFLLSQFPSFFMSLQITFKSQAILLSSSNICFFRSPLWHRYAIEPCIFQCKVCWVKIFYNCFRNVRKVKVFLSFRVKRREGINWRKWCSSWLFDLEWVVRSWNKIRRKEWKRDTLFEGKVEWMASIVMMVVHTIDSNNRGRETNLCLSLLLSLFSCSSTFPIR